MRVSSTFPEPAAVRLPRSFGCLVVRRRTGVRRRTAVRGRPNQKKNHFFAAAIAAAKKCNKRPYAVFLNHLFAAAIAAAKKGKKRPYTTKTKRLIDGPLKRPIDQTPKFYYETYMSLLITSRGYVVLRLGFVISGRLSDALRCSCSQELRWYSRFTSKSIGNT